MKEQVKIEDRFIGKLDYCCVVAEAGSNHNGDLELGKRLIESAKSCGCDAVKFQAFKTENLVTRNADKAQYQKGKSGGRSQFDMLRALEFSVRKHQALVRHAGLVGIPIFYSVFDEESADLIEQLGIGIFKLGSGELTNIPLIEHIARKKKPLILSTGMAIDEEIQDAVGTFRKKTNAQLILMNCSTGYPCQLQDANLRRIKYLKEKFKVPCGYSDHTDGILASVVAAELGAYIIEKHFTLDKNLHGPDHRMSMEPDQMKQLCNIIRIVEMAPNGEDGLCDMLKEVNIEITKNKLEEILGYPDRILSEDEKGQRVWSRKSIIAIRDIKKGAIVTEKDIAIKRPQVGILPKDYNKVLGRASKMLIKKETPVKWNMLE